MSLVLGLEPPWRDTAEGRVRGADKKRGLLLCHAEKAPGVSSCHGPNSPSLLCAHKTARPWHELTLWAQRAESSTYRARKRKQRHRDVWLMSHISGELGLGEG